MQKRLSTVEFQLYAYNNETGELYRQNTSIRNQDIHVMAMLADINPIPMCPKPKSPGSREKTVQKLFTGKLTPVEIAVIATAAAVVFLIFLVILFCALHKYRVLQANRLKTFTESQRHRGEDNEGCL